MRTDGGSSDLRYRSIEDVVHLRTGGGTIPLAEIYEEPANPPPDVEGAR